MGDGVMEAELCLRHHGVGAGGRLDHKMVLGGS